MARRTERSARKTNSPFISTAPPMLETLEPRLLLTTWGPLIQFDTWSQGGVYDDYVPLDPGGQRSDVGCVATAASQVLYYWNYPTAIPFSSAATWFDWNGDKYTSKGQNGNIRIDEDAVNNDFPDLATLNSQLSSIDYDFDNDEMAYLSFGVGVKYEMNYSSDGSGAYTSFGGSAFRNDFAFGSAEVGSWPRDTDEIVENIKSGWPVLLGIRDSTIPNSGHSVVVDGYRDTDTDDRFHVNLGWGGDDDGWYSLPDIPTTQWVKVDGAYTTLEFDRIHTVVYNIAPYQGWAQVGADAQNTYASPYRIPSTEPDLKWECTVPAGMSRYKFKDMVVGSEGEIYASLSPMDLGQGKHPYVAVLDPHGVIDKTIVISDSDYDINYLSQNSRGEVFFGSSEYATKTSVYRVNAETDTVTRMFDHTSPDRGIFDQPIKIDGSDYLYFLVTPKFTSNGAKFYSLTRSGSERWSVSFPSQMKFYRSSAAIDEARNQVYLNYYDSSTERSYVGCFERANGSVKWTHAFPGTHTASEMASPASVGPDGTVYVGCFTSVYALSPTNGGEIWSTDFYPSYVMGEGLRAVGTDGRVYVGHGKMVSGNWRPAYVSALDPSDGSINWQREIASGLSSFDNMGEIYAGKNGMVAAAYTRNDANRLAGIMDNGANGQVVWDVEYGGKMAFGPGQTIYVVPADIEASIYALSVGDRGDPDGLGMAFTNNQRPALPSNLGPADGSEDLDTTVTLSWACSDPDPGQGLLYDIYLGGGTGGQQGEMVPVGAGFAGTSLVVDNLAPGESYVWRVIATDGQTITPGPAWTFSVGALPTVNDVMVSSTSWDISFLAELGGDGYWILSGADQLATLPWTNIDQVKIVFSEDVNVSQGDLSTQGINVSDYAFVSGPDGSATRTATWTLSAPIAADKLLLVLSDDVTDTSGNRLDGEWTDGTSTFPSGNGAEGGDFQLRLNVLPGDVNQSEKVTLADYVTVRSRNNAQPGEADYDVLFDVNGSGKITLADYVGVRSRKNDELPTGEPVAPLGAMAMMAPMSEVVLADAVVESPTPQAEPDVSPLALTPTVAPLDRALPGGWRQDLASESMTMFPPLAMADGEIAAPRLPAKPVAAPLADIKAPFTADPLVPVMAAMDTMPVSAGVTADVASGTNGLEDSDLTVDLLLGLRPFDFDEPSLL